MNTPINANAVAIASGEVWQKCPRGCIRYSAIGWSILSGRGGWDVKGYHYRTLQALEANHHVHLIGSISNGPTHPDACGGYWEFEKNMQFWRD